MAMLTFASLSLFRSVLLVVLCLCCTGDARFKGFRRFVDRSEAIQHTARTGPKVEDHWFTQRLDHFNGADSRVWKQVSQCGSARPSQDLRSLALGGSSSAEDWGLKRRCVFSLQRYFINDTFYRPGEPVFLMIGGEGPANPAWMQYGSWLTYAEKLGALCFLLEHRFYGNSHPTE